MTSERCPSKQRRDSIHPSPGSDDGTGSGGSGAPPSSGKVMEENPRTKSKFGRFCLRRCLKDGIKVKPKSQTQNTRIVHVNDTIASHSRRTHFASNYVSTAKYTAITFFPKALFEQFRRAANLYFLFHAIVSLTSVSPVAPWTTWPALLMVISFSLIKEGIEDRRRHRQDRENNLSAVHRVVAAPPVDTETIQVPAWRKWWCCRRQGKGSSDTVAAAGSSLAEESVHWQEIRVGDIVKVYRGQFFPADLVFLRSSGNSNARRDDDCDDKDNHDDDDAADDNSGAEICFVDTKNLDGETNAKVKTAALSGTASVTSIAEKMDAPKSIGKYQNFKNLRAEIECDKLNGSLYSFTGSMRKIRWSRDTTTSLAGENTDPINGASMSTEVVLETSNLLLRSSSLKAPDFIYGAVVYTGHDTKVMLNALEVPSKRSTIDRKTDNIIAFMFGLLAIWCISGSAAHAIWTKHLVDDMWYLWGSPQDSSDMEAEYDPNRPWTAFGLGIVTSAVLYGYLIPISLYISLELVRLVQSTWLISGDKQMYCDETETASEARTSNLSEDLGRVAVVLSDKTGTLTRNQMDFYQISVAGRLYGTGVPDAECSDPDNHIERGFHFLDERLSDLRWAANSEPSEIASSVDAILLALALCHTVHPTPSSSPEAASGKYDAESPDEEAFVIAANRFGRRLLERTPSTITLREEIPSRFFNELQNNPNQKVLVRGRKEWKCGPECDFVLADNRYSVLAVIQFTSERKRMSMIVRRPDGGITLFCKGADAVMMPRLLQSRGTQNSTSSAKGSSTAVDGALDAIQRHLNQQATLGLRTLVFARRELTEDEFQQWQPMYAEAAACSDDENGDRAQKVQAVAEILEVDLELLGCTAVEDSLQKGVPQTLEALKTAGLRLWMLTGKWDLDLIKILGFVLASSTHWLMEGSGRLAQKKRPSP